MFYDSKSLISLDLSNFNTQDVTDMSYNSLISLDLSNFDIENVTNMKHMFDGCKSLISLHLNFNAGKVRI